ncbi:putative methyltransferase small domain protein [Mycobacterium kansasii 824]|nr:putative methyltransferase small domain protein [Mycobacterium kansasii 824]
MAAALAAMRVLLGCVTRAGELSSAATSAGLCGTGGRSFPRAWSPPRNLGDAC